ncbi:MAG TPA: lysophospholipid acyltransferase family protein [Thermoanaerobaculia bacterium]|nr:lysophospholipid acyltransferase family protein [Thermoanaerobaculia bacterium]
MPSPLALLRLLLRLAGAVAVTLPLYLALVAGKAGLRLAGRPSVRWESRIFRRWSRGLGRVFGMRREVRGTPPAGPGLLVANHVGYMDILLLGGEVGGVFVAKREIAGWPVLGHLCRQVGVVFVDRGARRDVLRTGGEVERALAAGRRVVLFPEGTTSAGDDLLPFRPSLLEGAAAAGRPVAWAVIRYALPEGSPPPGEVVAWTGGAPLLPHVLRLLTLPGFTGRLDFGSEPVVETDRKRLAHRLREAMGERLGAE